MTKKLNVKFNHGLGDCAQFAAVLRLYQQHGYDVVVESDANKRSLWQVAGINAVDCGAGFPRHGWTYPAEFEDLSKPDWKGNKTAFGAVRGPLPRLGSQQEVWEALTQIQWDCKDRISEEARNECKQFLRGLSKPIICLHSRGSNWQERKSLPVEVAFKIVLLLLERTGGSVVSLDFDRREPIVADARCKGIKPSWGHITVDRLLALYEKADLLIGVDSGPFHVANLSSVNCLGVFTDLHPVRVCLPNKNACYLVGKKHHAQWKSRAAQWNFAEYDGSTPSASRIVDLAEQMLLGSMPTIHDTKLQKSFAGTYTYNRIGHDRRQLDLLPDGTIGKGAADCERNWFTDGSSIGIVGDHGIICKCDRVGSCYRGRWTRFERMPVVLTPLNAKAELSVESDSESELAEATRPGRKIMTRGNGFRWCVDEQVARSDLDVSDHEDWIYSHIAVPRGGVLIDIGAFVGTHAIRVAKECEAKAVYAFEPLPKNFELMSINKALNRAINVELIQMAVGNRPQQVFLMDKGMNSAVSLSGKTAAEMTTIDLFSDALDRIDVILIDTEGMEVDVLAGAAKTCARLRPKWACKRTCVS